MQPSTLRFVRVAMALNVLVNGLAGLALLLAPTWFFTYLGDFPPFNQHYMGDAGAFVLPLSLGLLYAMRDPLRHRFWISIVLLSNVIHVVNHFYDDYLHNWNAGHLFGSTLPLLVLTILLGLAWQKLLVIKETTVTA